MRTLAMWSPSRSARNSRVAICRSLNPVTRATFSLRRLFPEAAPLMDDPPRWRCYLFDALVETMIARDVLLLTRVDKPALLRRVPAPGPRRESPTQSTDPVGRLVRVSGGGAAPR